MDLVADSDYEMDAPDWATQSQHETMDDAYEDPLSALDAPDVDVEFQDEEARSDDHFASTSALQIVPLPQPAVLSPGTQSNQPSLEGMILPHAADASTASQGEASFPVGHDSGLKSTSQLNVTDKEAVHDTAAGEEDELRDEEDELVEDQPNPQDDSANRNGSEDLDVEEEHDDQHGTATEHEASDEHGPDAVRVTFNGQDFVIWPSSEISSYLRVKNTAADHVDDLQADIEEVEAPALHISEDVLWQPLDSFFVNLREKKALGDFLEEFSELVLTFSDLTLEVQEDNVYCRDITLDDLMQLHHGLGYTTSLHVAVSERPRFITKYNELAQHVAKLVSYQLDRSDDELEQADQVPDANESIETNHASGETATELPEAAYETTEDNDVLALPQSSRLPDHMQAEPKTNGAQAEEVQTKDDENSQASERSANISGTVNTHDKTLPFTGQDNGLGQEEDNSCPTTSNAAHNQITTTVTSDVSGEIEDHATEEKQQTNPDAGLPDAGEALHDDQAWRELHDDDDGEKEETREAVGSNVHDNTLEQSQQYVADEGGEAGEEDELEEDVDPNTGGWSRQETLDADGTAEQGFEEDEYEEEKADENEEEMITRPEVSTSSDEVRVAEASASAFPAESAQKDEEEEQILEYVEEVEDNYEAESKADRPDTALSRNSLSTRKRGLSEAGAQPDLSDVAEGEVKRVKTNESHP